MKNQVLLMQLQFKSESDDSFELYLDARNYMMEVIIARSTKVNWIDATGSRAAFEGPLAALKRRLERLEKYQAKLDQWNKKHNTSYKLRLDIMPDPGLGLILPGDF